MPNQLVPATLTLLGFCVLTCQVTMMVVFMAGVEAVPDMAPWLDFQLVTSIFAIGVVAYNLYRLRERSAWRAGLSAWWRATPQWMLLAFVILALVMLVGELSFLLLFGITGRADPWREHIPLIAMVVCSVAFVVVYAEWRAGRGAVANVSGRWR
ncbi:MAG: hypothetical protein AAGJ86_09425 [Pseudomonadota bacterium]